LGGIYYWYHKRSLEHAKQEANTTMNPTEFAILKSVAATHEMIDRKKGSPVEKTKETVQGI
jgi:hypothetical protein